MASGIGIGIGCSVCSKRNPLYVNNYKTISDTECSNIKYLLPNNRLGVGFSPSARGRGRGRTKLSFGNVKCEAAGENSPTSTVYEGIYGPWSVDSFDVREVILYRAGLVTSATSFLICSSIAFLPPENSLTQTIKQNVDILYAIGGIGLGISLLLIHIYVTPIKRTLQTLWVMGVVGSFLTYMNLAHPAGYTLVHYVVLHNPSAVWFVGPLFASLTGLVFKEGLCYGKLEAGILTFIIPTLLLGHLTGLMDDGVKLGLLGSWMALFVIFAGRKFTQPIKDDIGDKSVFMFNALPENEKKALIAKIEEEELSKSAN